MKDVGYDVKERNLIINSEYARNNQPELLRFLRDNPKITLADYMKLTSKEQETILRSALLVTFNVCKEEWRIVKGVGNEYKLKVLDTKSEQCQICNTKIRYLFYIRNELTKIELCIGSECIKKYAIDKDNIRDFNAVYAKQIKAQMQIQALQRLNSEYPEIQNFVRNHKYYLRSNTYELVASDKREYLDKYQSLSSVVNSFLEADNKITLDHIGQQYAELKKLLVYHQTYFDKQEVNQWALTTNLSQSIISSPSQEQRKAIERLMDSATISPDSLQLFSDSKFRVMILSKISENLKGSKFHINRISPDGSNIYLDFQYERQTHKLVFNYIEFVNSYGSYLFDNSYSPINELEYIKKNNFKVDELFYRSALSRIEKSFDKGTYFYRENGDIVISNDSRAFLILTEANNQKCYMEIEFIDLIAKLYKSYILNDYDQILQWSQVRKKHRTATNNLDDLHDIINAYNRGYVDDMRQFRRR